MAEGYGARESEVEYIDTATQEVTCVISVADQPRHR